MEEEVKEELVDDNTPKCPECGAEISIAGHCATCYECGFSLCSL